LLDNESFNETPNRPSTIQGSPHLRESGLQACAALPNKLQQCDQCPPVTLPGWLVEAVRMKTACIAAQGHRLRMSDARTVRPDESHITIEHFLPLLVAVGAAGADAGRKLFEGFQHSLSTSAFQFA